MRVPGHRVIPESDEKARARLLVGRTVFTKWIAIFRYCLDTIRVLQGRNETWFRRIFQMQAAGGASPAPTENKKGGTRAAPSQIARKLLRLGATSFLRQAFLLPGEQEPAPGVSEFVSRRTCRP